MLIFFVMVIYLPSINISSFQYVVCLQLLSSFSIYWVILFSQKNRFVSKFLYCVLLLIYIFLSYQFISCSDMVYFFDQRNLLLFSGGSIDIFVFEQDFYKILPDSYIFLNYEWFFLFIIVLLSMTEYFVCNEKKNLKTN